MISKIICNYSVGSIPRDVWAKKFPGQNAETVAGRKCRCSGHFFGFCKERLLGVFTQLISL